MKKIHLIGWNENALNALKSLASSKFVVAGVTVPEGYEHAAIEKLCKEKNFDFSIAKNNADLEKYIKQYKPDFVVSASWPKIIPEKLLNQPNVTFINIHGALLPKNRGMHPINWAIIRGEEYTGITVHFITEGIDSGKIVYQKKIKIREKDDATTIRTKITGLAGVSLINALKNLTKKNFMPKMQDEAEATNAPKRTAEDGKICWSHKTKAIRNLIRALTSPYPNAFCEKKDGSTVKFSATFTPKKAGVVLFKYKKWFGVSTVDGVILVESEDLQSGEALN